MKTNILSRVSRMVRGESICLLAAVLRAGVSAGAETVSLIPTGAVWRYLDTGTDPGGAWRAPNFDASAWASGPGPLGYGEPFHATMLNLGSGTNRLLTAYFLCSFVVPEAGSITSLTARVLRDDGAVVYLNGTEVFRHNMPSGAVSYATLAATVVGGADETTYFSNAIPPGLLVNGANGLAVEVHQNSAVSADLSFDLALTAEVGAPPIQAPRYTVTDLGVLPGRVFSYAEALNDQGWAVGGSGFPDDDEGQASLFASGAVISIPISNCLESLAVDINSRGMVLARCAAGAEEGAGFLFSNGVVHAISELTGDSYFVPKIITEEGWLIGLRGGQATLYCEGRMALLTGVPGWGMVSNVVWQGGAYRNGVLVPLATLPGTDYTVAYAINNSGIIVGFSADHQPDGGYDERAIVQDNTQVRDLNTLIPTNSGWLLESARDINNRGQIVGYGRRNGALRAFLLTPVPPLVMNHPPTVALVCPTNGAAFTAPAQITFVAQAQDPDGLLSIRTVEFYVGTLRLAVATNLPTADPLGPFVWMWTNVPPNQYLLRAHVTDDAGGSGWSAPVDISVSPSNLAIVTITATDPVACEGLPNHPDTPEAVFTIQRRGLRGEPIVQGPLSVFYAISGTASNGVDYVQIPGMVPFAEGASNATVVISPMDDALIEGTETVTLTLEPSPLSTISHLYALGEPREATAEIRDNDPDSNLLQYGLRKDVYLGIQGVALSNLIQHPKFPDAPDRTEWIGAFEIPLDPNANLDNYGARLTGFVIPPETGDYTFYLSSDDAGALFLSTDANPAHKVLIASERGWSPPRLWTGPAPGRTNRENVSAPIPLRAGGLYYVEALLKEGGGGDHLGVAWQRPGQPEPANGDPPISGEFLMTWRSPEVVPPRIVEQPGDQTRFAGEAAVFTASAEGTLPLSWQWYFEGQAIPDATNAVLTLAQVRVGDAGFYHAAVSNLAGFVTTEIAWLTVLPAPGSPGSLDFGFNPQSSWEGDPSGCPRIWPAGEGRLFVSGRFNEFNGLPYTNLVRLLSNGQVDATFRFPLAAGEDGRLSALAMQPDGRILIAGPVAVATPPWFRLLRLLPDGRVDATFTAELGNDYYLPFLALQADGRVLIAGRLGDQSGVFRLEPNGARDWTFTARVNDFSGFDSLLALPDGRVLVGGSFAVVNGVARPGLARLRPDGSLDGSFAPATVRRAKCLLLEPDGRLLVAGDFLRDNGMIYGAVVRLNPDGSEDNGFQPGVRGVETLVRQPDAKIVIGGSFCWVAGTRIEILARLNSDGTLDGTFNPAPGRWACEDVAVYGLVLQPDGGLIVSGSFHQFEGVVREGLARLNNDALPPSHPGSLDPIFNLRLTGYDGWPGQVRALAEQADGKLWIGGWFTQVHGVPCRNFARLRSDGALDVTCPADVDGAVNCLLLQPDGRLLVGGGFSQINGVPRRSLARLHPNGAVDLAFNPVTATSNQVWFGALLLQPDGKIVIGGWFTNLNESGRSVLARLHPDGRLDTSFDAGEFELSNIDADPIVRLVRQPDGKILAAGELHNGVARFNADGSRDLGFDPQPPGVHPSVYALALQGDGKVLVGGWEANTVYRLHPDGTPDGAFHVSDGCHPAPFVLAVQADDKILWGGDTADWLACRLQRLLPEGDLDQQFNPGAGPNDFVNELQPARNGGLWVAGGFTTFNGFRAEGVARLHLDRQPPRITRQPESLARYVGQSAAFAVEAEGTPPLSYRWLRHAAAIPGATNSILRLDHVQPADAAAYRVVVANVAGAVTSVVAQLAVFPALTNAGQVDALFSVQLWNGFVHSMAEQADGRVCVAGQFTHVNTVYRPGLARLGPEGKVDLDYAPQGLELHARPKMAVQPDGRLLVSVASYDTPNGRRQNLARLHPGGGVDVNFNAALAPDFFVAALALQPDGRILVAGTCELGPAPDANWIVRLFPDGSRDPSFNVTTDYEIKALSLLPDGRLLLAGGFSQVNGVARSGVARLDANGSVDLSFVPPANLDPWVNCVARLPDGRILIAGGFGRGDHQPRRAIARLQPEGSLDPSFDPGAGIGDFDQEINALAVQADGRILIGGSFLQVAGAPRGGLARLNPDGSLDASFQDPGLSRDPDGDDPVEALLIQRTDMVLVGGWFSSSVVRIYLGPVVSPASFVHRHIWNQEVQLDALPPAGAASYAVEDQPPAGWLVSEISNGGVFDPATGKVKFGPFFDAAPRTLSYTVLPPPGTQGVFTFTGVASADGVNSPIGGEQILTIPGFHPADFNPSDWTITMAEVTAYGAAWRRGESWPVPPVPIPIDYVTRAGALWRGGECYRLVPEAGEAPLCWINCANSPSFSPGAQLRSLAISQAVRRLPASFVPGQPIIITVSASPGSGVLAYAVEDTLPAGWTVTTRSPGGEFDAVSRKMKWGPFFDGTARTLSYQALPPAGASGAASFTGSASFDGASLVIAGASRSTASGRLTLVPAAGGLALSLSGRDGMRFAIEASSDLARWTRLTEVAVTGGSVIVPVDANPAAPQQFFRAIVIEH